MLGGRIYVSIPSSREEVIGATGGRPLGLEVLADGRILACDSHRGQLRLDPKTGAIETLVEVVEGTKLKLCSNATAAQDGTIWFTESTARFGWEFYRGAMLEHRPTGRVFRRDPDGRSACCCATSTFRTALRSAKMRPPSCLSKPTATGSISGGFADRAPASGRHSPMICPDYSFVTGVTEANGKLYLASLHASSLLAVDYS